MFLLRLLFSPVKVVLLIARVMGYNRFVVFLLGVGVGLLVAPTTGAEMRARLKAQVEARTQGAPSAPHGSDHPRGLTRRTSTVTIGPIQSPAACSTH